MTRNRNDRAQQILAAIFQSAVDAIVVIDAQGRVEAFNPAAERLFGYSEGELLGRNVTALMPSPYSEAHDGYLARYLATAEAKVIGIGREVTGRRRDGTEFPLHLSVGEMTIDGERKFTGILHDLSARVQLEAQLREQAALVRLGEMAAVIAHEVKNPLAGIRGAVQVIGSRLPEDSREALVIGEIVGRIDTLNGLVQDLLLFARPPQPRPVPTSVTSLVETSVHMLASDEDLKEIRVSISGSAPPVLVDAELLKIVFLNLLLNGAHAMQGRGKIRVSVKSSGAFGEVAFVDEGPGIPSDIREKIFTPFFTTKSRGTGLGLPTARRFIEVHGGSIAVECPPEGGTVVTVRLPLVSADSGTVAAAGPVLEPA